MKKIYDTDNKRRNWKILAKVSRCHNRDVIPLKGWSVGGLKPRVSVSYSDSTLFLSCLWGHHDISLLRRHSQGSSRGKITWRTTCDDTTDKISLNARKIPAGNPEMAAITRLGRLFSFVLYDPDMGRIAGQVCHCLYFLIAYIQLHRIDTEARLVCTLITEEKLTHSWIRQMGIANLSSEL